MLLQQLQLPCFIFSRRRAGFLVNPLAVIFALGFVTAGFALILIEERSSNVKHLQLVCGMSRCVHWLSAFTWDLCSYAIFIAVLLILFVVFQVGFQRVTKVHTFFTCSALHWNFTNKSLDYHVIVT